MYLTQALVRARVALSILSMVLALFLFGVSVAWVSAQELPPSASTPSIKVKVNEINLSVSVHDSRTRFVPGLGKNSFRVFDNNREQPIIGFLSADEPAQVVLLMESGPAVFLNRKYELQAAEKLLRRIPAQDRVAVVTYSRLPSLLVDFTDNKIEALATLQQNDFRAGFTELNLAFCIGATLDWLSTIPGKKTVLLLSSGVDTSSAESWQTAQTKIRTSDVRIVAASVSEEVRKPAKGRKLSSDERVDRKAVSDAFRDADQLLRLLTQATGGHVYYPKKDKDFDRAFSEIAESIRGEYRLTIAPTAPLGVIHELRVKLRNASYRVESRTAYLAPNDSPL
jgi:VWFA-related protein